MTKQADVPGIGRVVFTKRRTSRHVRLRVTHDGTPHVSLPFWLSYRDALKFVMSKQDWITKQQGERHTSAAEHGQRVGKSHYLSFVPTNEQKIRTRIRGNEASVYYPSVLMPDDQAVQKAADKLVVKALKLQSEALLPQRLEQLAKQHDFTYRTVKITKMRSRWGSCSSDKLITLNCYLIQLPWELIDYVLVHELVHTKVLSHSAKFWALFEQVLPDAKARRKAMKQYRPHILPLTP